MRHALIHFSLFATSLFLTRRVEPGFGLGKCQQQCLSIFITNKREKKGREKERETETEGERKKETHVSVQPFQPTDAHANDQGMKCEHKDFSNLHRG